MPPKKTTDELVVEMIAGFLETGKTYLERHPEKKGIEIEIADIYFLGVCSGLIASGYTDDEAVAAFKITRETIIKLTKKDVSK